jgi:hypothetical protein
MNSFPQSSWLSSIRLYFAISAILHLIWEMLQLPLYTIWSTGSSAEVAFAVLHCTTGDLMIASLSLLIALLVVGNRSWPSERFTSVMMTTIIIGIGYTVYSEWVNTAVRKTWQYSNLMPTLPVLGTGLSPFIQWLIVPSIAFLAVRFRHKRQLRHR